MATSEPPHPDPDTIRDTVPIRPLPKWASRLLVTAALAGAAALGLLAARMMGDMATDPSIQERFEAIERMRAAAADTAEPSVPPPATADSTMAPPTGDSTALPR